MKRLAEKTGISTSVERCHMSADSRNIFDSEMTRKEVFSRRIQCAELGRWRLQLSPIT